MKKFLKLIGRVGREFPRSMDFQAAALHRFLALGSTRRTGKRGGNVFHGRGSPSGRLYATVGTR